MDSFDRSLKLAFEMHNAGRGAEAESLCRVLHSPDWRWFLDRLDSPWYSTAQLFRQPERGEWKAPIL